MTEPLLAVLCLSQAVQGCVLAWCVVSVRRHDQVLTGLPELIAARDKALAADLEAAVYRAMNHVMEDRANERARKDAAIAREIAQWGPGADPGRGEPG